ncbi:NADPH dehydrogenase NamA [Alkalihalobacterium elongatum]|uniref:NADPH dehydrogenase NamA n=1 Tax=Alkalihalobacterium elongatum TaxID=2675466 RepID=UPI001C1FF550|nr:NADPH dehydrogenase NamA [Alkalihalobacterium elongatum]
MNTALFSSITIKNVTLHNRIVMSPMCMYTANIDGKVKPFHLTHYGSRAIGGVGLVMIEATSVTPEGRISNHDLGIWNDEQIEGLRIIVKEVHLYESKVAIQLAHAGRKAMADGDAIAPNTIPFNEKMKTPIEMDKKMISDTIQQFKAAAIRAKEAGFDIIEIHGAHGYLINQFLSPLTNKRTDEYGGSAENRYRFLEHIITEINTVWSGPLFVRISANEYSEGGNDLNDFIYFAKRMKDQGVDLIDVSSGGVVPAPIQTYPGYQVPYAERIRNEANIKTGAVGLITSGIQAEEVLQNERADLIFIGRELLRNPYWALQAAKELKVQIPTPRQYERSWF